MKDAPDEINTRAIGMMNEVGKASFPTLLKACGEQSDSQLFLVPVLVLAAVYDGNTVIASCSFHLPQHSDEQVAALLDRVRGNIQGEFETQRFERRYRGKDEIQ